MPPRIEMWRSRSPNIPACDVCLRPTARAKRVERGLRYCAACYKRLFASAACVSCGQPCTALRTDLAPKCARCRAMGRRCIRCERDVPRAGRVVADGVACPSCAYHFLPERPCPSCGRDAPRLSVVDGRGDAVCDRCRRSAGFATCSCCGRHRRAAAEIDGRPRCGPCVGGVEHACPDCRRPVSGAGRAPCRPCSARRRGRQRMQDRRTGIDVPWAASLFVQFCEARLFGERPHGAVVRQVDAVADFFAEVGRKFATEAEVSAIGLRDLFGAERLRYAEKAVAFLSERLSLAWDGLAEPPDRGGAIIFEPRSSWDAIEGLAASHDAFLSARLAAGSLSVRTVRTYRRTRSNLLAFAKADRRRGPNERDVRRLLWAKPGARASLGSFLAWLKGETGINLAMPRRASRDAKSVELRLIGEVGRLMADLGSCEVGSRGRALLARVTARLLGMPLEEVLLLRRQNFAGGAFSRLCWRGETIALPAALSSAYQRLVGGEAVLLFGGRGKLRPSSPEGVRYHLRKAQVQSHSTPVRCGRVNSSLDGRRSPA